MSTIHLVRRSESERAAYILSVALERLADLRRLVLPQIHGHSPKQYAERGFDGLEVLLAGFSGSLSAAASAPTHDIECDACGIERAIVRYTEGSLTGNLCGKCAEEMEPEHGYDLADKAADEREAEMNARWEENIAPVLGIEK